MKKTIFGVAVVTALIIAGCSKSDDGGDSREKMIQGKWTPAATRVYVIDRSQNTSKTTYPAVHAGDYWDFRGDGKLYTYETDPNGGHSYDTLPYKLGNPWLIIDEDTLSVGALTKDSLVLELHEGTPTQDWFTTFTLKK
jgi:hypothetical protein